jgi:hypothetical protein
METLTKEQAFKAMVIFLEGFYERTQSDDVGGLLGDMILRENGTTADSAAWEDWIKSVRKITAQK